MIITKNCDLTGFNECKSEGTIRNRFPKTFLNLGPATCDILDFSKSVQIVSSQIAPTSIYYEGKILQIFASKEFIYGVHFL